MMYLKKLLLATIVVLSVVGTPWLAGLSLISVASAEPVSKHTAFLTQAFNSAVISKPQTLWLTKEVKQELKALFDYDIGVLRVRYWAQDGITAWILDEVGKEQPITMGLAINAQGVKTVQVLEYRESRGGEIQYPFFTEQFDQAVLQQDNKKLTLDRHIDGITGATLSVRAMTKVTKVALFLHQKVTDTLNSQLANQS